MTFSYDEEDSYDETNDFDETDDFDDEPQEAFLDEEDDDSTDLESPDTALSQAFREATATEVVEEDYEDEKEEDAEEEEEEDEQEDSEKEVDDQDTKAYEQRLAEAIDALPDEEDLEVELPPLELPSLEIEPFRPQEQSNYAYADAVTAYYEEKNYQRAIEKFSEAIENEAQDTEGADSNEIVAKAMYWQAEAYVKMQNIPQAIGTFESLVQNCQGHYLVLAAQRRADELNAKDA